MFIRKLILQETKPKIKIIRSIPFKLGINLIVDDSKHSGNNVGKTTTLKIIDICLGEKDKSSIYTDQETNLINKPLKDYIHNHKIEAILELSIDKDNLNNPNQEADITLSVELFSYGRRKINNQLKNIEDNYFPELNKLIFNYSDSVPDYIDLIKKFVRVEMEAGAYNLLRFSSNKMHSNLSYRIIYNFLFNLIDEEENKKIANNRSVSKKYENDIVTFNKFLEKKDIFNLEETIKNQIDFIQSLSNQIKINSSDDNFIYKIEELRKLQTEIELLNQKIGAFNFQIKMIEQNLDYTFQSDKDIDTEVLQVLYNETNKLKLNVEKTFSDLIQFNNSLVKNKIKYYNHVLDVKSKELEELHILKKGLNAAYIDISSNIKNFDFDKSNTLYEELTHEQAKLLELQSFQSEINVLNTAKSKAQDEYTSFMVALNLSPFDAYDNLDLFNEYFAKNSKKILGITYKLGYDSDINNFPLYLLASDESISIGTKKGLISAFDLSYIQFAKKINKLIPHFIVYDVIETIESDILTKIFNLVKTIDCQYIVAVLNEKIKDMDVISDKDKILILSKDNKLFMK
ncbi:hypothetical protein T479_12670 [Lysinibacillus varians]|nr:hypothetical protein [Lysinibacillus varians]AHN24269.1 hypothetical protein T479_12670 [Lysinibacillus varians]